jgi:hypothetical protein
LRTTKVVVGTVVEVNNTRKAPNNRVSTFITADFDIGGGSVKRSTLNIRSVKLFKPDQSTVPSSPAAPIPAVDNADTDLAVPEQEEGEAVLQETSPDEELEFPA